MTTVTTSALTTANAARSAGAGGVEIPESLRAAYACCATIARQRARNFYYGLRLTPEPKRSAIYSVYAWMRAADDQADAPGTIEEKRARLQQFRDAAELLIARNVSAASTDADIGEFENDPVWRAFRATFRDYALDPRDVRDMLRGLEDDLAAEHAAASRAGGPAPAYESRDDLLRYCYRVASTVGLICVSIWGLREASSREEARRLAIRRGHAFQLTNILRDFAQDFGEGRVYLPSADFRRAKLGAIELRDWSKPEACAEMVGGLARWARAEYRASAGLEELIDPSCVATLWTMTSIYSGLLDVIERNPNRVVSARRVRLPSWRKAALAVRGVVMARGFSGGAQPSGTGGAR
ncbi:MAG TPA: phytoene/squalene synthase family protein [Phycisphaerales bacterium]|nr:phytoene/squalene synthase family protein [Phycisphaerales bacterium]